MTVAEGEAKTTRTARDESADRREAASADREAARQVVADHERTRTRDRLRDHELIADGLQQTVVHPIFEAGMMLDAIRSLSHDPAVIERTEAAIELLDGAVTNIRRVALDLAADDQT